MPAAKAIVSKCNKMLQMLGGSKPLLATIDIKTGNKVQFYAYLTMFDVNEDSHYTGTTDTV